LFPALKKVANHGKESIKISPRKPLSSQHFEPQEIAIEDFFLVDGKGTGQLPADLAGAVAAITENDPGVLG
jgi:hypothetical protein